MDETDVKTKYKENDLFTLLSIHNLPVYVSFLVGLGLTWGIFTTRMDHLALQVDGYGAQIQKVAERQYQQDLLLERISTRLGMTGVKGVSTSSANLRR